jgi:hypothetical protein
VLVLQRAPVHLSGVSCQHNLNTLQHTAQQGTATPSMLGQRQQQVTSRTVKKLLDFTPGLHSWSVLTDLDVFAGSMSH